MCFVKKKIRFCSTPQISPTNITIDTTFFEPKYKQKPSPYFYELQYYIAKVLSSDSSDYSQ